VTYHVTQNRESSELDDVTSVIARLEEGRRVQEAREKVDG